MWADNETKDDLLGYQVHADLLRDVVLDPKMLPISIGVFGDWGSGKSSLMLLMQESIEKWRTETEEANKVGGAAKKNARVLQIMFNSWQFEDYEDTKLTLIETILSDVIKDIEDHRDFFEKADACLSKIKYLKLGVVVLKNLARKIIPKEIQELLPNKEEWKEISKEDQDLLLDEVKEANSSLFIKRFREDFTQIIADGDYRSVVVYVDDLDRCSPKRIIQCLEAVKLFVNVDKTAFVIGADQRIIEHAIHEQYKTPLQQTTISSPYSDYLEKLIQLPYKLPKLSYSEQKRSHKKSWKRRRDKNGKPILHCGFCLPCIYRRVALDAVGWGKKEPVGVNVFNVNEIGLSNPEIRKSRDFKALLYFLRKRYNRDTIEGELIANGVYEKQELEEYTTFLLNSYNQVKAWVDKYGNAQIKRLAGI